MKRWKMYLFRLEKIGNGLIVTKLFIRLIIKKIRYVGPSRQFVYELNKVYALPEGEEEFSKVDYCGNGFHACLTIKDALKWYNYISYVSNYGYIYSLSVKLTVVAKAKLLVNKKDLSNCYGNQMLDKGKIVVSKETVLVEAGDEVSAAVASTLSRMDINPMEVGIDLRAVYEEEAIYTSEVLAIDEEQTLADVQNAFRNAFNLSVNAAIPTEETISTIITLAYTRAINVGVDAAIMTSETSEPIIGLAQAKMLALASEVSGTEGALDDELAEKLSNVAVAAAPVVEETVEEEEEEEEEEDAEEEAAAGLGALFG